jgi:hypothetical protein
MMFRIVFWDILPCKMMSDSSLMMEAVCTSETSVDNHFTRQYIPEDNSELNFPCSSHILSFWSLLTISTGFCKYSLFQTNVKAELQT